VKHRTILCALLGGLLPSPVMAADPSAFHALYKVLVETDTSLATGSCTAAAGKTSAAMLASGFPAADIHTYATPDHPKEGGLVAILPGADPRARAVLLVAHIDVVAAPRADWKRDPFVLTEDSGYFYGRGVSDNKAMAATLVDTLIRLHAEGFRARRTIKVALTCGEETATAFNGSDYLVNHRRDLIDAGLVLIPSGGAITDEHGHKVSLAIQAGEKTQQNYRLQATGTGTHASRPTRDNAIYALAAALVRLGDLVFPVTLNPTTRLFFERTAATSAPDDAAAIRALLADPGNIAAQATITANTAWNAMLRTTCTATVIETGTQLNTVAPHAAANVNCRLLPGQRLDQVTAALAAVAGPTVTLRAIPPMALPTPSPLVSAEVLGPIEAGAAEQWPGVPIVPTMLTGATDARHFNAVGMPAYGLTAFFYDADGNNVHAPNERANVAEVYAGRAFMYQLIRRYGAGQ